MDKESESDADRSKVRGQVRRFMGNKWQHLTDDQLVVKKICGGFLNESYVCSIADSGTAADNQPNQVFVRFYGNHNLSSIGEAGEAVAAYIMAINGLGPKVYAIFPGGRLDEFVDSTMVQPQQAVTVSFRNIVARKLAKMHALEAPIARTRTATCNLLDGEYAKYVAAEEIRSARGEPPTYCRDIDIATEVKWLKEEVGKIRSDVVFCHNDLFLNNILIRNRANPDPVTDDDVVLVDYDLLAYNFRGYEFGYYFKMCTIQHTPDTYPYFKMWDYPDLDMRRSFIEEYLRETEMIKGVLSQYENVEYLLRETQFFALCCAMGDLLWGHWDTSGEPAFQEFIKVQADMYLEFKQSFLSDADAIKILQS